MLLPVLEGNKDAGNHDLRDAGLSVVSAIETVEAVGAEDSILKESYRLFP